MADLNYKAELTRKLAQIDGLLEMIEPQQQLIAKLQKELKETYNGIGALLYETYGATEVRLLSRALMYDYTLTSWTDAATGDLVFRAERA